MKEIKKTEWSNRIIYGDNLLVMQALLGGDPSTGLSSMRGKIDLIYIDPPFDSKADYRTIVHLSNGDIEQKPTMIEQFAYSDTWKNGTALGACGGTWPITVTIGGGTKDNVINGFINCVATPGPAQPQSPVVTSKDNGLGSQTGATGSVSTVGTGTAKCYAQYVPSSTTSTNSDWSIVCG